MKTQAIIFDLDGTIIDTKEVWIKATKQLLHTRGIKLAYDEALELDKKMCGIGMTASCSFLKKTFGLSDSIEKLMHEKKKQACALYTQGIKFIPGFERFHATLSTHNIKTGVATSSERETMEKAVQQLNLTRFFGQHIYDIQCVNNRLKPDPAIYLYAAQKLGVAPSDCIAIEDSPVGIRAAQSAGIKCIGIDTAGMREAIRHADLVISGYDQIDLENLLAIR